MTKLTQQFPFPVSKVPRPDVLEDSATWLGRVDIYWSQITEAARAINDANRESSLS
jgi:hypothetical protein